MDDTIHNLLEIDNLRGNFIKYTKKVFSSLPALQNPRILDIGCGTGLPTLTLAELTPGEIVGIDPDLLAIEVLQNKIKIKGLESRVKAIHTTLHEYSSPQGVLMLFGRKELSIYLIY